MGVILASAILSEVDTVLLDTAGTRWLDAEKLVYLNAGQRQIVFFKPDAYVVNDVYALVAGTKQSIPDGTNSFQNAASATLKEGVALVKAVRNMGADGLTPGAVISPIGSDFLDSYNPDWHTDSQVAAIKNYILNNEDPKRFYVTPPNNGTGYVEVIYSALPADVATTSAAITLADVYRDLLVNYVLFRCYDKDAALSPLNVQRAASKWNLFVTSLGRMDLVVKTISPNMPKQNPSTEVIQ